VEEGFGLENVLTFTQGVILVEHTPQTDANLSEESQYGKLGTVVKNITAANSRISLENVDYDALADYQEVLDSIFEFSVVEFCRRNDLKDCLVGLQETELIAKMTRLKRNQSSEAIKHRPCDQLLAIFNESMARPRDRVTEMSQPEKTARQTTNSVSRKDQSGLDDIENSLCFSGLGSVRSDPQEVPRCSTVISTKKFKTPELEESFDMEVKASSDWAHKGKDGVEKVWDIRIRESFDLSASNFPQATQALLEDSMAPTDSCTSMLDNSSLCNSNLDAVLGQQKKRTSRAQGTPAILAPPSTPLEEASEDEEKESETDGAFPLPLAKQISVGGPAVIKSKFSRPENNQLNENLVDSQIDVVGNNQKSEAEILPDSPSLKADSRRSREEMRKVFERISKKNSENLIRSGDKTMRDFLHKSDVVRPKDVQTPSFFLVIDNIVKDEHRAPINLAQSCTINPTQSLHSPEKALLDISESINYSSPFKAFASKLMVSNDLLSSQLLLEIENKAMRRVSEKMEDKTPKKRSNQKARHKENAYFRA
jgi:hypothetical protein